MRPWRTPNSSRRGGRRRAQVRRVPGAGSPRDPAARSPRAAPPPGGERPAQRRRRAGGWEPGTRPTLPPSSAAVPWPGLARTLPKGPSGSQPERAQEPRRRLCSALSPQALGTRAPRTFRSPPGPSAPASVPPQSPLVFPTRAPRPEAASQRRVRPRLPPRPPALAPDQAELALGSPRPLGTRQPRGPFHAAPPPLPEPSPRRRLRRGSE